MRKPAGRCPGRATNGGPGTQSQSATAVYRGWEGGRSGRVALRLTSSCTVRVD